MNLNKLLLTTALLLTIPACLFKRTSESATDTQQQNNSMPREARKRVDSMDDKEALICMEYFKRTKHLESAINCGQRFLAKSSDQKKCAQITLELIDLNLELKDYEKALKFAKDYKNLYPGSSNLHLACIKEIQASLNLVNDCERDQSQTKETIELAKEFLKNFEHSEYTNEVYSALKVCYETLFESEKGIIESYIQRHYVIQHDAPLKAANLRLEKLKEDYAKLVDLGSARVLDLEIKLAQVQKQDSVVKSKIEELSSKYPDFAAQKSYVAQHAKRPMFRF